MGIIMEILKDKTSKLEEAIEEMLDWAEDIVCQK
jgi:hypothetical protein